MKTGKDAVKEGREAGCQNRFGAAAGGFVTDAAKQILMKGKEPRRVDLGRALKKAKEPPQFGVADRLRAETRGKPKGGYTTYSYDAAWVDRSGNSHSYQARKK